MLYCTVQKYWPVADKALALVYSTYKIVVYPQQLGQGDVGGVTIAGCNHTAQACTQEGRIPGLQLVKGWTGCTVLYVVEGWRGMRSDVVLPAVDETPSTGPVHDGLRNVISMTPEAGERLR